MSNASLGLHTLQNSNLNDDISRLAKEKNIENKNLKLFDLRDHSLGLGTDTRL